MAVELIAIAEPSTSAPCQLNCQLAPKNLNATTSMKWPARVPTIVISTCISPRPNTRVRMLRSLGRLNSSPITNIRNTTPNSAR